MKLAPGRFGFASRIVSGHWFISPAYEFQKVNRCEIYVSFVSVCLSAQAYIDSAVAAKFLQIN